MYRPARAGAMMAVGPLRLAQCREHLQHTEKTPALRWGVRRREHDLRRRRMTTQCRVRVALLNPSIRNLSESRQAAPTDVYRGGSLQREEDGSGGASARGT